MTITFTIPGRISGKGRPRAAVRGGFARMYTDAKTRSTEAMIRSFASEAMNGHALLEGPLKFEMQVFLNKPQSWSKKRKASATWVTGKPDADNILKACGDSLNGIVFRDDSQISDARISRLYTDGAERVCITVQELAESPSSLERGM